MGIWPIEYQSCAEIALKLQKITRYAIRYLNSVDKKVIERIIRKKEVQNAEQLAYEPNDGVVEYVRLARLSHQEVFTTYAYLIRDLAREVYDEMNR